MALEAGTLGFLAWHFGLWVQGFGMFRVSGSKASLQSLCAVLGSSVAGIELML